MDKIKRYTWNAEDYAKHSSAQQDWARELISKLALDRHEFVLDIGCGDGKVTAEIAGHIPEGSVLGVDSSPEMIALACKAFPPEKYPNLTFQHVDARHLPFKEQFDLVFSNAALHWITNHTSVLKGIKNTLKPNGRLLLQMGGKGNAAAIISVLDTIITENEWRPYFENFEFPYGFHDTETYTAWLTEAGLFPMRVELIPKKMSFKDADGLAGWIRTTWLPYTDRLPNTLKKAFVATLVETYVVKYPPDQAGNIQVDMMRLEVEACLRKFQK